MNLKEKAKVIVDYLSDDHYKQAVLINGAWGTGKTFFVDKILTEGLKKKGYIVIRYSLYGSNSCDQIRDDIVKEILINKFNNNETSNKSNKKLSKILGLIPSGVELLAKYFGYESHDLTNIIEKLDLDTNKIVVVFDDLERSTAEINNVLGLINSYVENKGLKVIIVANEDEIGSSRISTDLPSKFAIAADRNILLSSEKETGKGNEDSKMTIDELTNRTKTIFSNDIIYNSIKEKLVGLSITLNADFHQFYEDIAKKYASTSSAEFLIKYKEQVLEILQMNDCQNLRTLIFSVITFDKIYLVLDWLKKGKDEEYVQLLETELLQILRYVTYKSIMVRAGEDKDMNKKQTNDSVDLPLIMSKVKKYKFVDQLILYHEFNSTEVENYVNCYIMDIIQENKDEEERKKLSYYKLVSWGWIYMDDNDVVKYSNQLYEELVYEKYDARFFRDIIVFLLQLDYHFIEKKNQLAHKCNDYIALMEKYIQDHALNQNLLDQLSIFPENSDFTQKYNEYVEPIINAHKRKEEQIHHNEFQDIFSNDNWDTEFREYCRNNRDTFINSHSFLSSLAMSRILEKIKGAKNDQIREFALAICSVYDFGNIRDFFQSDVMDLKKIVDLFQSMIEDEDCGCTKKYILQIYKEKLDKKLNALK